MDNDKTEMIYSGASPEQVAVDLAPLVDFQDLGMPLDELKSMILERLLPHLMRYDLPGFQSMFNAFPEEGAAYGAAVATDYNQGVTNWQVSPGGATLEELCCKALCRLFGLSPSADATFTYSGTYANQQALYLALHQKAEKQGFDFAEQGLLGFDNPDRLVVLTSQEAHFSLRHALRTLGLGEESLLSLPVDDRWRIDIRQAEKAIHELEGEKDIFCIVPTSGTTSTGSVDPIQPLSRICEESDIWLHVDGAYGLAYSLVPEWNPLFNGIEKADSICWDPHKQFGVPIPNSLLFLRRREDFYRMTLYSDYFNREDDDSPNPGLKSPPSTRPFSALPLVTSLKHQGMRGTIQRLRAPLEAIKETADYIDATDGFELLLLPDLGILCFRVMPNGFPEEMLNQLQQYIMDKIMAEGKRTISVTKLDGITALRLVAISTSVSSEDLKETVNYAQKLANQFLLEAI
jgi:L-2,4-diaminobutyrate decarboxylase